ncbi:MAG: hypothetical protein AAFO07_30315, partial [Bacteroidota bacterium]
KSWNIYINVTNFKYCGMDFELADESFDEKLIFEGEIEIQGVKIPRIRHWYQTPKEDYMGSDIIIKML